MIEAVDERLKSWVAEAAPGATALFGSPESAVNKLTASLYLLEMTSAPLVNGQRGSTMRVQLGYLVTAHSPTATEAHALLGTLVFSAMQRSDMEVDLRPLQATMWKALGLKPQPAFMLRVPLEYALSARAAPRVRKAIVTTSPGAPLMGRLLGPGNEPIADAEVECPSLSATTRTDTDGCFVFPLVPAKTPVHLHIRAKGASADITTNGKHDGATTLVIHFDPDAASAR